MGDPAVAVIFSDWHHLKRDRIQTRQGHGMPWFSGGRTRVFSTITGSWPLGIMILIGLGLMAFFPVKPKKLADSGREARPQADPFTRTASAPAVPPGSNPLVYLEVADFMGGRFRCPGQSNRRGSYSGLHRPSDIPSAPSGASYLADKADKR